MDDELKPGDLVRLKCGTLVWVFGKITKDDDVEIHRESDASSFGDRRTVPLAILERAPQEIVDKFRERFVRFLDESPVWKDDGK